AAHLANAGIPSYLLDIVPPDADGPARNKIAEAGLQAAVKSKPAAFFEPSLARLVTVGNFDDNLKWLGECDWIIEAVVENLDIKRSLLQKVESVRKPGTLVTTNTSGLPVQKISEGFSEDFRRHWFGTHFFNPPRYMRLLEIIPTPDSDRDAIRALEHFCDVRLGKGIVEAKDVPNFIANRIGTFSALNVMRVMQEMDLSVEEADALTGSAVGWPKTGTFRLTDMVGLDILGHVVRNFTENLSDERADLKLPDFYKIMLERKLLGDKTKAGFYKKQKSAQGEERFAIDWKTLEYRPRQKPKFPALEMAKNIEETPQRLRTLLGIEGGAPNPKDKAGQFLWAILSDLWTYSANRIGEVSDTIVEIDRAMRMGFNWELGPFELWDAAGVEPTVARMKAEGKPVAANVARLLESGKKSWYVAAQGIPSGRQYFEVKGAAYVDEQVAPGITSVQIIKKSNGVVKKNAGASLIDLGDGVGCIEFHTKMNALGGDIVQLVQQVLKPGGPGDNFDAFVITNDAQHFSAGANIMMLLMAAQEEEWDDVDLMIKQFQAMTQAIKFSPKPVVTAPFGMTLGGGCEIALHSAARHPHAELYMGLVEVGVGLLPGGGGCKEMVLRAVDAAESVRSGGRGESVEFMEAMKRAFETIAMAKVSTSVAEASNLGFLSESDQVTMNRDRLVSDAKAHALELARNYQPPRMRTDIPAAGESILATLKLGVHLMRQAEYISDHEVKIGNKVAEVLCGGNVTPGTLVSEQYYLDLEREAFKSLCGEKKTQERIAFTLKTGKPLRN
ncbi:MAG: 3-hydroxyacyl-CoA dehydrogenase NAD-binding domain-containing protein, partial [Terriglobales bacterium]